MFWWLTGCKYCTGSLLDFYLLNSKFGHDLGLILKRNKEYNANGTDTAKGTIKMNWGSKRSGPDTSDEYNFKA
jgi:hypothetical protein